MIGPLRGHADCQCGTRSGFIYGIKYIHKANLLQYHFNINFLFKIFKFNILFKLKYILKYSYSIKNHFNPIILILIPPFDFSY